MDYRDLKELSHEIVLKLFDNNLQNSAQLKARLVFKFLRNDCILQKVYLLRLMPVCVGLIMVSCLFLSVYPIKWSIIEQG